MRTAPVQKRVEALSWCEPCREAVGSGANHQQPTDWLCHNAQMLASRSGMHTTSWNGSNNRINERMTD
jgi:hypothetical protein